MLGEKENSQLAKKDFFVGLDIGTTKIVCLVGAKNEHGKLKILGYGKAHSIGVKRGVVVNIVQTIESIKHAVKLAKEDANIDVQNVSVGIAGQHIRSLQHIDYINREDEEKTIDNSDLKKLEKNVSRLRLEPGEDILHIIPQEYKIDQQANILEPIGMCGSKLEANFHVVAGQTAAIRNIQRCVIDAGLNISSINLEPLASSSAVLSQEEKDAGVVLVDIGGGTTDIAIFKDGRIRHTAVIPFGGNIITSDIKEGCAIIEKQAEQLKIKFGSALPTESSENEIVSIPGLRGRDPKEISVKNLSKIIKARLEEILKDINREIRIYSDQSEKNKLIGGIVLTGGGSKLKHIKQLTEFITGMSARIGFSNEHLSSGFPEELSSPIYATAVGLVLRNIDEMDSNFFHKKNKEEEKPEGISIFEKWKGGILEWLANEKNNNEN